MKGNSLVASLQVSRWRVHVTQNIRGTGPEKNDIGIPYTSGTNAGAGNVVDHYRPWATRGSVSWFRPDLFMGSHDFKAGYDDVKTTSGRGWDSRVGTVAKGDYGLRYNNNVPIEILTLQRAELPANHGSLHGRVLCRQVVRRAPAHAESRVPLGA